MAARLFGLSENPFKITPDLRFLHRHDGFDQVRRAVRDTVLNGTAVAAVSGRPGMGKTMLLSLLAEELRRDPPDRVTVLLNCAPEATADALLDRVDAALRERGRAEAGPVEPRVPPVLLLDEAQNLAAAELGRLIEAAGPGGRVPDLRMVLAGAPDLETLLATAAPGAPAFHRRLRPLSADEALTFITERLRVLGHRPDDLFSDAALEAVLRYASGVPRLINSLCATSLFLAEFESHRRVSADLVKQAARSLDLVPPNVIALRRETGPPAVVPARPALPAPRPHHPLPALPAAAERRQDRPGLVLAAVTAGSLALLVIGQILARNDTAVDAPPAATVAAAETPPDLAAAWIAAPARPIRPSPSRENAELKRKVASLLAHARDQVAALKLTTPAGNNALETYREVLALMPGDAAAIAGIHDLGAKYAELSARAARQGRWSAARLYYERGIAVAPEHPALLALTPASRGSASWWASRPQVGEVASAENDGLTLTAPWEDRGRRR